MGKDGKNMVCHKPKFCLKETQQGNEVFLGQPFVYEDEWLACHLCKDILERKEMLDYDRERDQSEVCVDSVS
jgi:hypothetical protein